MEVVKYLSSLTALDQSGSPQQQAVLWIANIDPRQIQIGKTFEFQSRYALAVLYFATGGGSGHWEYATEMGWLGDADVCDWNTVLSDGVKIGVDCLGTRTVRTLVLPHSGLINNIPDEISILYDLETIDFSENDLTGRFNPRLGDLKTLQTLVLRDNAFTGSFPQFLGIMSSLQYVDLSKNNIKGSFPDSIFDLGRMTTLNIGYNHISDDVTKFMGLTSIQNLLASDNEISGHLNFELLNALPHLNILDLSSNQLQGSLPSNLFELSQLSIIDLHGNYFGGTIPQTIANPSPLKFLALGDNALTGEITWFPTHFPSTMEHLDLANNSFTGRLPAFGTMQGLNYLFLAFNPKLDPGPIPPSFTRLPNLIELSLQQTGRTGTIPKGFGSLSKLVLFDLSDNSLTGTIPDDFGNATLIQFLFLNQNYLNGTIPASFSQFSHLNMLLLEKNAIRGDTTMICEPKLSSLQFFSSDCSEVNCPLTCCSLCCINSNRPPISGSGSSTDYPTPSPSTSYGGSGSGSSSGGSSYSGIPGGGAVASPTTAPGGRLLRALPTRPTISPSFTDDEFFRRALQNDMAINAQHMCDGVTYNDQLDPQIENQYKRVVYDFNQYVPSVPVATEPTTSPTIAP